MPSNSRVTAALTRLFTPTGVVIGTLLGSLIAAVAMIWMNYRVLGYRSLGDRIGAAGIVLYLMILLATALLPNRPAITVAVMVGQCAVAWWVTQTLQGSAIAYHRARGGGVHGTGMAGLVGLVTGLVAAAILLLAGRIFGLPIGIR